jgi:hypothetical protein
MDTTPNATRFFVARKQGALGIATEIVEAKDFDEFCALCPDLEILASYATLREAQHHTTCDTVFTKVTDYGRKR